MSRPSHDPNLDALLAQLRQHYPCGKAPSLGAGRKAAVLVVDFIEGFTNAQSPLAGKWDEPIACTVELLRHAQSKGVPAIFTTVEYDPIELEHNLLVRKAPRVSVLSRGSRWTEVDHRLPRTDSDLVITKKHGSAFFGTALASHLLMMGVDTLLIAGCVTSGCVRASAVDAAQLGFRPLVVRDAVADRSLLAHEANLLDIEARYGDVLSIEQALSCIENLS